MTDTTSTYMSLNLQYSPNSKQERYFLAVVLDLEIDKPDIMDNGITMNMAIWLAQTCPQG